MIKIPCNVHTIHNLFLSLNLLYHCNKGISKHTIQQKIQSTYYKHKNGTSSEFLSELQQQKTSETVKRNTAFCKQRSTAEAEPDGVHRGCKGRINTTLAFPLPTSILASICTLHRSSLNCCYYALQQ